MEGTRTRTCGPDPPLRRHADAREPGNFALAGHRIGTGAVFQHLDRLDTCDAVVVETESNGPTYRVLPLELRRPNGGRRRPPAGGPRAGGSRRRRTTPTSRPHITTTPTTSRSSTRCPAPRWSSLVSGWKVS
ncbi:sortase [Rhodococcus hoagii]|nr:sortase [Prescottella equi]